MTIFDRRPVLQRTAGVVIAGLAFWGMVAVPAVQSQTPTTEYPKNVVVVTPDRIIPPGGDAIIEGSGFLSNQPVDVFTIRFVRESDIPFPPPPPPPPPSTGDPSNDTWDEVDDGNIPPTDDDLDELCQLAISWGFPCGYLILPGFPGLASTGASAKPDVAFALSTGPAPNATLAQAGSLALFMGGTVTDGDGNFRFDWGTSGWPEGEYTLVATDGVNVATVEFLVSQKAYDAINGGGGGGGAGSGSLPQTGGVNQLPLRIGALLLAAGGVAVLASRRRRRTGFTVSG
jgi:LPXTG-motif cell wall-anchored protein